MRNQRFVRIVIAILFVLIWVVSGSVLAQDDTSMLTVSVTAEGLSAPETLPAGLVTLNFEAPAEAPLISIFARLGEGITPEALMAGLFEDPAGIAPQVTFKGSPFLLPGQSTNITYNLESGEYILLNVGAEMPQVAMISVTGDASPESVEPDADLNITMVDFGYGLPLTIPAGQHIWRVENVGKQWHEMAVVAVEPGTTLDDIRATLASGEEPGAPVFALMPMNSGEQTWMQVSLEPGTYAIVCHLPDIMQAAEGHIHHELGMLQLITVADTLTYEDPNGLFSLDYNAGLTPFPELFAEVMPFPNIPLANSQAVADLSFAGEPVPEGGWGIAAIFLPKVMFAEMGIAEDADILEIANAYTALQLSSEDAEIPDAQLTSLYDGTDVAQIDMTGIISTEDNLVVMYEISDGVIALASLLSASDGRTDEMVESWWLTVNSMQFTGTADDLMMGMDGE